jgi:hypothetical protein
MSFVKEVGLIIDLHQSPVQEESILKQAVNDLYIPLIRLIKSKRDMKITLSVPLSLLELLDKYGFTSQISELKDLYTAEKIDLVGSSAYGALLDNLPNGVIENQVILNEYALGYYFGALQGFEGEPSIMIKDLQGFVPSQLYINNQILNTLSTLGYRWVLTNTCCISAEHQKPGFCVYKMADSEVEIIKLEDEMMNIVNSYGKESLSQLRKKLEDKIAEEWKANLFYIGWFEDKFGKDSYKKEFELIDILVETLEKSKVAVIGVSELIKKVEIVELGKKETLGYQKGGLEVEGDPLFFYFSKKNEKLDALKDLDKRSSEIDRTIEVKDDLHDIFTLAIWKEELLKQISDTQLHAQVCYFILLSKFMSFDKYLCLNSYLAILDSKETSKRQLYAFSTLVTRGLDMMSGNPSIDEIISRSKDFTSSL